jgi:hypothetical protein
VIKPEDKDRYKSLMAREQSLLAKGTGMSMRDQLELRDISSEKDRLFMSYHSLPHDVHNRLANLDVKADALLLKHPMTQEDLKIVLDRRQQVDAAKSRPFTS